MSKFIRQVWGLLQSGLGLVFRHPITGTSIIPVLEDGRIVLIQRRDTGRWGFPGGMIDWGEDLLTSVSRELTEETGLELVKLKRLVGIYSAPDRDPRFHSICIVVEAEVRGTMQVQDTLEILDVQAFLRSDIPRGKLSHDHDQQLDDYFDGRTTIA
jgi:ADP-ribose pyrophosphatase YjhB (NUDIX family)